jgi:Ca2+-binding EF-hand superfamily protein
MWSRLVKSPTDKHCCCCYRYCYCYFSLGLGKNGLAHMFEELAQSNVEGLSLALLRDLATRVDFNVSAEKMRNVFHAIDKDQTGRIMYQEMFQVHVYTCLYIDSSFLL